MSNELSGRVANASTGASPLPIIGKIKCGDKTISSNGKEIPRSLDHFIATGEFASMFHEAYGAEPTRLTIIFPSDDVVQVCNERHECRDSAGRLTGISDGTTAWLWNADTKKMEQNNDREAAAKAGKWRHTLTLRFILPEIRAFGVWEFKTGGTASTIPQIRDTFDFVMSLGDTVKGIPFELMVEKVISNKPGSSSSYPVVKLVPKLSPQSVEKMRMLVEGGVVLPLMLTDESVEELANFEIVNDVKELPEKTV